MYLPSGGGELSGGHGSLLVPIHREKESAGLKAVAFRQRLAVAEASKIHSGAFLAGQATQLDPWGTTACRTSHEEYMELLYTSGAVM